MACFSYQGHLLLQLLQVSVLLPPLPSTLTKLWENTDIFYLSHARQTIPLNVLYAGHMLDLHSHSISQA